MFFIMCSKMGKDLKKNLKTIYSENNWPDNIDRVVITYHDCGGTWFLAGVYIKSSESDWFWTSETEMKLKKGLEEFYTVRRLCFEGEKNYVHAHLDYRKEKLDIIKRKQEMVRNREKKVEEEVREILKNLYVALNWPDNISKIDVGGSYSDNASFSLDIKTKYWSPYYWTKENLDELKKAFEKYCYIESMHCLQHTLIINLKLNDI